MEQKQLIEFLKANCTKSYKEIGAMLGISRQRVFQLYQNFNIKHFVASAARIGITIEKLKEFQKQGLSREEIAGTLQISSQRVERFCNKLGVSIYSKHEEKVALAQQGKRRCVCCQTIKDLTTDNFHKNKNDKNGFNSLCIECNNLKGKKAYHEKKNAKNSLT